MRVFCLNIAFLYLLLFVHLNSIAQINLVYNGDFEIYDTCPTNVSGPGDYQIEHCTGWYSPSYATPDYFNACCPYNNFISVPQNVGGYQCARSGVAYCGFLTYSGGLPNQGYWCEYIQTRLIEPLESGRIYNCTFYLNCANEFHLASSKIGAYCSSDKITGISYIPFDVIPHVCSNTGFITDTINWIEISGTLMASGGEEFLTIGHFGDTLYPDTIRWRFDLMPGFPPDAYYYIDDVSVQLSGGCNNVYVPNIFSPNSDGINDLLFVRGSNINELEFSVFNRWGEEIFSTNDINTGWDGAYRGNPCESGVYVYYIIVKCNDGTIQTKKGNITIMR